MNNVSAACPQCGHVTSHLSESQNHITSLGDQVQHHEQEANLTSSRLSELENEIATLRTKCARLQEEKDQWLASTTSPPPPIPKDSIIPQRIPSLNEPLTQRPQSVSRLSSFSTLAAMIPGRNRSRDISRHDPSLPPLPSAPIGLGVTALPASHSTPNLTNSNATDQIISPAPTNFAADSSQKSHSLTLVGLQTSLETERDLRLKAESNLTQAQSELEDLTAQLFGQANEMIATERKARAKLEERVKTLENRDSEKRKRLDRLETAVARIERVRAMCAEPPPYPEQEGKANILVVRNADVKAS